jgi:hypothetical protein
MQSGFIQVNTIIFFVGVALKVSSSSFLLPNDPLVDFFYLLNVLKAVFMSLYESILKKVAI